MGFIKALIGLPFVFVIMVFAFVNNDMVNFNLWPTGIELTVSLSVAIVFFVVVGYILGWLFTWFSYASVRRSLKIQKKENKKLSKEQEKLTKEVEGLHGNIENLRAFVPSVKKNPFFRELSLFFLKKIKLWSSTS